MSHEYNVNPRVTGDALLHFLDQRSAAFLQLRLGNVPPFLLVCMDGKWGTRRNATAVVLRRRYKKQGPAPEPGRAPEAPSHRVGRGSTSIREEKAIVAIQPKPASLPRVEGVNTREASAWFYSLNVISLRPMSLGI